MAQILKQIPFRTEADFLKNLAYNDNVYAWLLLHSHYSPTEQHNYIYKNEFTFKQIAADIHRNRDTVSKRFKELEEQKIIIAKEYNGKKAYKIPYYNEFEALDGPTVLGLLTLPVKEYKEELIKTYAYLLARKREQKQIDKQEGKNKAPTFRISSNEIIKHFGHSNGNTQTFDRFKLIFTILKGAGIIDFVTIGYVRYADGTFDPPKMEIVKVNQKADDAWLGIKSITSNPIEFNS